MEMKKIACLLLILILMQGVGLASGQVEVLALEGKAEYRKAGFWLSLSIGTLIPQGTQVRTFEDTKVLLAFAEGHQILLGSNTDLTLANTSSNNVKLSLSLGKVWSRVRKQLEGLLKFEIETPSAVAGVRGTQFSVEFLATGVTHVAVWEGRVWVGSQSQEVDLYQKQATTADPQLGLFKPRPISEQEKDEWEEVSKGFAPGKGLGKLPPGLEKKKVENKWGRFWEKFISGQGRPWEEGKIPFGLEKDRVEGEVFPPGRPWLEGRIPFGPPAWAPIKKDKFLGGFPRNKKDLE